MLEKSLKIKGIKDRYPIIQGGMGIGVSLYELASAVGKAGGIGTISNVALDQFTLRRLRKNGEEVKEVTPGRMNFSEAVRREVSDTKKEGGVAAINLMCALPLIYEDTVKGAVAGGIDMFISGAGSPIPMMADGVRDNTVNLPYLVRKYAGENHNIALVPIVSSRAILNKICKAWEGEGYLPDAVVLEGPKAGGHIGWGYKRAAADDFLEKNDLFDMLPDVIKTAQKYGNIPIYVAGGIFTNQDIEYALSQGASGVQMGTRFAVTKESGFEDDAKRLIIESREEDIVLADQSWGSPCGFPFRYNINSPLALNHDGEEYFCICTGLEAAAGLDNSSRVGTSGFPSRCPEGYVKDVEQKCLGMGQVDYSALVSCGSDAYRLSEILKDRIDPIMSVQEVMKELSGN